MMEKIYRLQDIHLRLQGMKEVNSMVSKHKELTVLRYVEVEEGLNVDDRRHDAVGGNSG